MSLFPSQDAFTRGEVSPRLHSRASLDLYKAGLSKCENFISLPHGGLRKRGGTFYVDNAPYHERKSRMIPFIFSDDQAYAIVLSHNLLRVYAYGARVGAVEIATPWPEDQIFAVKFVQSADEMWLVHPGYDPRKLIRRSHTVWEMISLAPEDGPFKPVNTNEGITMFLSAATGLVSVNASAPVFTQSMVGALIRIEMESYTAIPPWEPNAVVAQPTLNTVRRYDGRVYKTPTNYNAPSLITVRTGATPPTHKIGTEWDGPNSFEIVPDIPYDGGTTVNPDIYHGLQWTYLHSGFGVARITSVTNSQLAYASVLEKFPDELVGGGPFVSSQWSIGSFSVEALPSSVTIFEERLVYGERFSVYGSKTGDLASFEAGPLADDAIIFRNAGGGKANDIVWLEDVDGYLAIGTIGGVRSLSGAGIDEALTSSSFKNRNSRTLPCAPIQPVKTTQSVAYVAKGRRKIAELKLGQSLRFESDDLGQISEHIPKKGVVELAFQENPDPVLWFPLDTGELGGFTHQPSQEVRGMHRHRLGGATASTQWGVVESCCVTPGQDGQDQVWLLTRRTINGVLKRFIEIMTPGFEYDDITDAFQVDAALSYSGGAVNAVSGLAHLGGQKVDVLADGKVYRGLTVSGSTVTLPGGATAAKWHVGLPVEASADTLELDVGGRDGSIRGRRKRITSVILSVLETDLSGLQIASMQKGKWEQVKVPTIAASDGKAKLYTGNVTVPIDDSWEGQGRVTIKHVNPTPCTIRAMTPVFDSEP